MLVFSGRNRANSGRNNHVDVGDFSMTRRRLSGDHPWIPDILVSRGYQHDFVCAERFFKKEKYGKMAGYSEEFDERSYPALAIQLGD